MAHLAYVAQAAASAAYAARAAQSESGAAIAPAPFASYRWTGNDLGAPTASGPYAVTTVPVSKPAAKGAAAKPADKPALSQQLLNSIIGNLGTAIKAGKKPQASGCSPDSWTCPLKAMAQTMLLFGGAEFDDPDLPGESQTYIDQTTGGSIKNIGTSSTRTEFADTLTNNGWIAQTSKDGTVQIFTKDGAKYVLREKAASYAGWSADFTPAGSPRATLKIRLGVPG